MHEIWEVLNQLLGLQESIKTLTVWQIMLRSALIYVLGFLMLRFGEHRFLGKNTAFDIILGFIFGSMLSRVINGSGPFLATLLAGIVLLGLHWLFATATLYSDRLSELFTGKPLRLINDGELQDDQMVKSRIGEPMLRENLRINGQLTDPKDVQAAYYEPSGSISVIPKDRPPRVLEVEVEEGVQTVRIEL